MRRFLIRLLANAVALWLTTLILSQGLSVKPYEEGFVPTILTYLLLVVIFGIVNGIVGNFIKAVAFPIYVLTLGLAALVVNGLLLLLVGFISSIIGFGLIVNGLGWGILGAFVLGILSWGLGIIMRRFAPGSRRR